ncbi:hypothetical protein CMU13_12850 [Elizabethkingia anophelis]|nr:hypothetical protein [Elizabethkingia anophelis]
MEAKELRIGNYLHDRNGNLCKVIELRQDGIYAPAINKAITGLPNKPIELTEEWLLNFGFTMDDSVWKRRYIKLFPIRDLYFRANMPIVKDIRYVHEVQNLFFALTGEELTIKS